jgi:hypothetical protein
MLGPQLKAHVLPFLTGFTGLSMRLDPGLSDAIDDRRGQGGGFDRASADGGGFPGGGMGRGGPGGGPWPGPRGGGEDDARGDASPGGGFPGGGRGPPEGRGGVRCWDSVTKRDVPMALCDGPEGDGRGRRR